MSFILDALKKLERDKQSAEPGVVMVGPVAWGGRDRGQDRRRLVTVGAALAAIVVLGWWGLGSRGERTPAPAEGGLASPSPSQAAPTPSAHASPSRDLQAQASRARAAEDSLPGVSSRALEPPESPPPPASGASSPLPAVVGPPVSGEESSPGGPGSMAIEDRPVVPEDDAPTREFRLTAISERDGEPIALLNDRLVREGDRFGGLTVIRIGKTEVEIEVNGERKVVGF